MSLEGSPRRTVLENGLVLVTVTRSESPLVAVLLLYRAGSLYDPAGRTGLAHLTEHMMFRGTPDHPQGAIDALTSRFGGTNNGMTTSDHALYYFVLPAEHWTVPLAIESDRMINCALSAKAFETERRIAIEERGMLDDDPDVRLDEAVDALAFEGHPYRHPIVGLGGDIERLTLDDVGSFYASLYTPGNAVLVVVGGIDPDEVAAEVLEVFGDLKPSAVPTRPRVQDPVPSAPRSCAVSNGTATPGLVVAYRTPEATHPDSPVLELLAVILASGRSSRLYRRLVAGRNIATEVSAFRLLQTDPGLFYVAASLVPGCPAERCEEVILDLLREIAEAGVQEGEIRKAQNLAYSDHMLGRETCLGLAGHVAMWEAFGGWELGRDFEAALARVRSSDVTRAIRAYFNPESRSSAWLVP